MKSIIQNTLIALIIMLVSGCNDELAHKLQSLDNTFWQNQEHDSWEEGSSVSTNTLSFIDNKMVIWGYQNVYKIKNEDGDVYRDNFYYDYIFDPIMKRGVIIGEDYYKYEFEIRGNLLYLFLVNEARVYTRQNR